MSTYSGTWNLSYYELDNSGNGNWIYTKPILSDQILNYYFDNGILKLKLIETGGGWKGIWGIGGNGMNRQENVKLGGGGLFYGEISCSGNCVGFIQPWKLH